MSDAKKVISQYFDKVCRVILRNGLRVTFGLRAPSRHAHLSLEKIDGLNLLVPPEVFNPALFGSSLFLAKYLRQHSPTLGSGVLDLGCGSGFLGLTLARSGANVIATDINPQAVWAATVNAHLNGFEANFVAHQGSLYEPLDSQKFDLIVMNPPYYPHAPTTPLEQAFQAGPHLEVLGEMLLGAAAYLQPTGRALAVVSSTIPLEPILRRVEQAGLVWRVTARRRYWAEWHLIYELRLTQC